MQKLFSYGTLQQANVQRELFGRTLDGHKDTLEGYQLSQITITDQAVIKKSGKTIHPILRFTGCPSDIVEGSVYQITDEELAQADHYEVEQYLRVRGQFSSGKSAWIYACRETETKRNKAKLY